MRVRKYRTFVSDFETTVYKGVVNTEVWASAAVELFTDDVFICGSIEEQFEYFKSLKSHIVVYYHNLKFDGEFWMYYLLTKLEYRQAYTETNGTIEWLKEKDMPNNSFKYSISEQGNWYTFIIKTGGYYIELRDSYKLLPFSLDRIGKAFKTKHQKLAIKYEGIRYANCPITEEEKEYIRNDVLVIKEALEIMQQQGHTKLTIGSCCLEEYKSTQFKDEYNNMFPDMYSIELNMDRYKYSNAGEYLRRSYRGGWCYLAKGKEKKIFENGCTADVNSLYPSVMHSESGNYYPTGKPHFWRGDYIPDIAEQKDKYYFIRIKTRFYLKPEKLPFIQIKNTFMYRGNESLITSDIYDDKTGLYHDKYYNVNGELTDSAVEMVVSMVDYKLIKEHYNLVDFKILDGCWFYGRIGIFDDYINKYREQKLNSEGALRELAKLFLNNLYGKMASNTNSSFKIAYLKDNGIIGYKIVTEYNKKAGYIPVGSAITSYARDFTIRAAQANYNTFIYADTDSIHCEGEPNEIKGIKIHDKDFNCWKIECVWDKAYFLRQKSYIEHVINDGKKDVKPYYDMKCAGMGGKCKELFIKSMEGYNETDGDGYNEIDKEFLRTKRDLTDFKEGLIIPGKLYPIRTYGGIVLQEDTYELRS